MWDSGLKYQKDDLVMVHKSFRKGDYVGLATIVYGSNLAPSGGIYLALPLGADETIVVLEKDLEGVFLR